MPSSSPASANSMAKASGFCSQRKSRDSKLNSPWRASGSWLRTNSNAIFSNSGNRLMEVRSCSRSLLSGSDAVPATVKRMSLLSRCNCPPQRPESKVSVPNSGCCNSRGSRRATRASRMMQITTRPTKNTTQPTASSNATERPTMRVLSFTMRSMLPNG